MSLDRTENLLTLRFRVSASDPYRIMGYLPLTKKYLEANELTQLHTRRNLNKKVTVS